jgi:glycosyltransferase involved in cell wall biosynthesis
VKVAFLVNQGIPFHGKTLELRPLGGTETAVIRLAEALSQQGVEVVVLTTVRNPPVTDVLYLPLDALPQLGEVDVIIAVRDWNLILVPAVGKKRFFWTGDSYDQPLTVGIGDRRIASRIDTLFSVSEWHGETLCQASGFPLSRYYPLRNGVHLPYFEGEKARHRKRLFYSSMPYRGLALLPEIFTKILESHADAELHIFSSYDTYQGGASPSPQQMYEYEDILKKFQAIPRVSIRGTVPQKELAHEMMQAAVLAYPNTFEETSCITVMEAKAAGCVVVSSAKGALPETVGKGGILIKEKPGTSAYTERFVEAANKFLSDDLLFNEVSLMNRREAFEKLGWNTRAKELLRFLERALSS